MAKIISQEEKLLLFQGDSITDGNRMMSPDGLGWGYVQLIADRLHNKLPYNHIRVQNRGISGNRLRDLEIRWQKDCVALQPDYLSILIGINDTWRMFDQNIPSSINEFETRYRKILEQTKKQTKAKLVLCTPFVLPDPPDRTAWREDVEKRVAVTHKLAEEYNAKLVPFDQLFDTAAKSAPCTHWLIDGVHPTKAGYELMADLWMQVFLDGTPL